MTNSNSRLMTNSFFLTLNDFLFFKDVMRKNLKNHHQRTSKDTADALGGGGGGGGDVDVAKIRPKMESKGGGEDSDTFLPPHKSQSGVVSFSNNSFKQK